MTSTLSPTLSSEETYLRVRMDEQNHIQADTDCDETEALITFNDEINELQRKCEVSSKPWSYKANLTRDRWKIMLSHKFTRCFECFSKRSRLILVLFPCLVIFTLYFVSGTFVEFEQLPTYRPYNPDDGMFKNLITN